IRHEVTAEMQHLEEVKRARDEIAEEHLVHRAPTVAFLGHVDHGKTSLIDKIRQTRVADGESGGITQHIGAYQVETATGHGITIVDTPGHEAFTAMRARGAKAVDIVVLVVAGDDGVKPSTAEAINHARAANTPIVVALNKKDKPGFNAAQAIQQLMGHELIPEAYGGQTAFFEVSAMTGEGIEALLEHIFLMSEAELDMRAHPGGPASGVVLEAQVEQGRGIVAHLLMQDGTLNQGDVILAGGGYGKVKSIHDDRGRTIKSAGPSTPVQVTGLAALPGVGDPFYIVSSLDKAKEVATERERNSRAILMASNRGGGRELERILGSKPKIDINVVNLIVRTDVQGSAEVIRHEVEKLVHEEVEVKLVNVGVGPITESDVNLASTSGALLVAFHVGVNSKARKEAERFGLDIRRYEVIYELLDDLRGAMEGALAPEFEEEIVGHVEIRRLFKSSKIGLIAGCVVLDGRIRRSSKIRLLRDNIVVHTGELGSLRREAEDTREVREGFECGIVIKDYRDIEEGDIIEAFKLKEIKRKLGELKPTDPDDKG
ncbi:MAG: translation initiation factor IF-2, partial [Planctomycetota bacterium]|nr:translation initiation factor IF-2 [Planctomycetota bacterium]